ncbi:hypothetical protein T484DRAFT_1755594 [Baffinella frigidus]|nr:hypothetical protein T484DRAFT_1755594 [Cryptophyta sp. CCMP2293]
MAMFVKDVAYLGSLQGVCAGPRDRYARVLAVVHAPVPCKEELVGSKCIAVPITIVKVLSDGYSVAPYAMAKKGQSAPPPKEGEKAEPLFRMDTTKSPPELEVWSYVSKGMNRGPRVAGLPDDNAGPNAPAPPMYVVGSGTTFVWFVNTITFPSAAATTVLPTDIDWIPAMSLVEISIAPRHSESCLAGRGINVKSMRVSTMELDAVFQNGIESMGMPYSAADASRLAHERRERHPAILKDVEVEKVSFVVPSGSLTGAYMGELPPPCTDVKQPETKAGEPEMGDPIAAANAVLASNEFVKICVGSGSTSFPSSEYVDVPVACLQKQTNTRCDLHACAMLDVAFALGAVDLFCITDDRFANRGAGSSYRAIPVINTKLLFASLQRVRSVAADHAMVAVAIKGVVQTDAAGVELLERVELLDEEVDSDDDDDDEKNTTSQLLTLSTGVDYDDGVLELTVKVNEEDVTKTHPKSTHSQLNVALALVGPGVKTTKGYGFSFSVNCVADESRNVGGILTGFINRAPCGAGNVNVRKRKAIKME